MNRILLLFISLSFVFGCTSDKAAKKPLPVKRVQVPKFSEDGAYNYIEKQLSFGYRIPGTDEHKACKDWMVEELTRLGADVHVQEFDAKFFTGEVAKSYNIIAQINPKHKSRIFIAAHWDSRRVADHDPDESMQGKPIEGADDGGSGVGVAMEIAKTLLENPIDMGVDIVLFDAEDQGEGGAGSTTSWCLGSQHWSRNLYPKKYSPRYGILLDMIGSENPRFAKDYHSVRYAPNVVNKIWGLARDMGYSDLFVDEPGCQLTDDHFFVNTIANIPTIDIINQINQSDQSNSCFVGHWHTLGDDISVIDKRSLRIVGQVVTAALYKESGNQL